MSVKHETGTRASILAKGLTSAILDVQTEAARAAPLHRRTTAAGTHPPATARHDAGGHWEDPVRWVVHARFVLGPQQHNQRSVDLGDLSTQEPLILRGESPPREQRPDAVQY